jgi:hypothetical protein
LRIASCRPCAAGNPLGNLGLKQSTRIPPATLRGHGLDPSMLHDRAHRSASSAIVCALGGRSSQGTLAALRERHLARCRWFGGHPRRRRTCRGRAPMPPLRMRVPCRPGAAPRHQPLPPSAAYTHRTAAPRQPATTPCAHVMWSMLACGFVYGGCCSLQRYGLGGTPGRRRTRTGTKAGMSRWSGIARLPVHLSARWTGVGCRPLGGAKV